MTKQDVIYFLAGIDCDVLISCMVNGSLCHSVLANDMFTLCVSESVPLPAGINPLVTSIFITKHGKAGYVALLEHVSGRSVLPQHQSTTHQHVKLTIVEELNKLHHDFGNVDVSKVTKKDMIVVEQLMWLRHVANWTNYCGGSIKDIEVGDYWIVVPVMGVDINVLLTRDMLAERGIGRKGDVIGEQRAEFDRAGLTGLCDLAVTRKNLTLTDSLTEVSTLTKERKRLTAENMSLLLQMNAVVGVNKKYLTDADYMTARKQREANKTRISEIVKLMNSSCN